MLYQIENKSLPFTPGYIYGLSDIPHIHTHLELVYLHQGSSIATVDNMDYLIDEGDLFLSFPNQIHYYHDQSLTRGNIFIFSPDLFPELKKLFDTQVPLSPIIKKELLPANTKEILDKVSEKNASDSSLDQVASKGYFMAFLGEVLPHMTLVKAPTTPDSMKNLLSYCSKNFTEPITLDTLSEDLHLNKYYISHIFKERMNMSLTDFVNNLRVEYACMLLKKDVNITEIAFTSGFSSVRTFNRAFLRNMGMTPRDYIKIKDA